MFLGEVLVKKENIRTKILELQKHLGSTVYVDKKLYQDILSELYRLIDSYRSYSILVERSNFETIVTIGSSQIKVAEAVAYRDAVSLKIDTLNKLVENTEAGLGYLGLLEQRENLIHEFNVVDSSIARSDWSVEIDQETMG